VTSLFPADSLEVLPFDGSAQLFPQFFNTSTAQVHFSALINEVPWEEHQLVLFGKINIGVLFGTRILLRNQYGLDFFGHCEMLL
jgi:hypothetical protein